MYHYCCYFHCHAHTAVNEAELTTVCDCVALSVIWWVADHRTETVVVVVVVGDDVEMVNYSSSVSDKVAKKAFVMHRRGFSD